MRLKLGLSLLFLTGGLFLTSGVKALAGPKFTLTPTSGQFANGSSFSVVVGVNSETEKVAAMDVIGSFDATKLEITSIEKAAGAVFQFNYDPASTPIINNATGTFIITLNPISTSVYDATVLNGDLLKINFKAKSVGVAVVNFTCRAGAQDESNIGNQAFNDVIDCASNQSGSYTIGAAGGDTGSAPTPTTAAGGSNPTAVPTVRSASPTMPQTGGIGATMGLISFGLISLLGAVFLRWL